MANVYLTVEGAKPAAIFSLSKVSTSCGVSFDTLLVTTQPGQIKHSPAMAD
jgi:hypothetical protein